MAEDSELKLKVTVDTAGAKEDLKGVEKAAEELGKTASGQSSSAIDKLSSALSKAESAAKTAFAGFVGAVAAMAGFGAAVSHGAEVNDLADSLDTLARSAGTSGDAILNGLKAATDNTIPSVDLMKAANEALLAGIKPEKFDAVAKAARQYADATGGDALTELNAFVDGLQRGDERFLKSRGLILETDKVVKDYAASLGIAAKNLTEEGKATAIRNAAIDALAQKTSQFGEISVDAGDAVNQVTTALKDQYDKVTATIAANPRLVAAFSNIAEAIRRIDFAAFADLIARVAIAFDDLTSFISNQLLGAWYLLSDAIGVVSNRLNGIVNYFDGTTEATERARTAAIKYFDVAQSIRNSIPRTLNPNDVLFDLTKQGTDSSLKKISQGWGDLGKSIKVATLASDEAKKNQKDLVDALGGIREKIDDLTGYDAFPELRRQINEALGGGIQSVDQSVVRAELNRILESIKNNKESVAAFGGILTDEFGRVGEAAKEAGKDVSELNGEIDKSASFGSGLLDGLFGGKGSGASSSIGSAISGSIVDALNVAIKGGKSDD